MRGRGLILAATLGLVLGGVAAGAASAAPAKSYCSIGGTFTTTDPDTQSFLDFAIDIGAGGVWVVEFAGTEGAEIFPPNEPDESLADVINGADGDDDALFVVKPDFPGSVPFFYPVSPGPCPAIGAPSGPPG